MSDSIVTEKLSKNKDNWNQFIKIFQSRILPQFPDLGHQFKDPPGEPSISFKIKPNINDLTINGFPVYSRNDPTNIGIFFPYLTTTTTTRQDTNNQIALVLYMSLDLSPDSKKAFREDDTTYKNDIKSLIVSDSLLLKQLFSLCDESSLHVIESSPDYPSWLNNISYNRSFNFINIAKSVHAGGNSISKFTRTTKLLNAKFNGNNHAQLMSDFEAGRNSLLADFGNGSIDTINVNDFSRYLYLRLIGAHPACELINHDISRVSPDGTFLCFKKTMTMVDEFIIDHPNKFLSTTPTSVVVNPVGFISTPSDVQSVNKIFPFIKIDRTTLTNNPRQVSEPCSVCLSYGWTGQARYHTVKDCAHNPRSPNFNTKSLERCKLLFANNQLKNHKQSSTTASTAFISTISPTDSSLDEFNRQVAIGYGMQLATEAYKTQPSSPIPTVPSSSVSSLPDAN